MRKKTTFKKSIEIKEEKSNVWLKLADFGNVCHGHPSVTKSFITSEQKEGIGATRHCDFNMMNASAEERVTIWNEGKNITIEVVELKKMPGILTMQMDLSIESKGQNTILTATMTYSMKNVMFDIMNSIMMKKMNSKLLNGILAGHKLYIEKNIIVDDKTALDFSPIVSLN
jgi:hypothetical protein